MFRKVTVTSCNPPTNSHVKTVEYSINKKCIILIKIIIIFLHVLGRLTFSGIDALPSLPAASTISSSSRFVVEGVFRQSGAVHSFKVVDPVLFVFESHVFLKFK